jgi:hypothetical protein
MAAKVEFELTKETKMECGKVAAALANIFAFVETDVLINLDYVDSLLKPEWAVLLLGRIFTTEDGKKRIVVKDVYMPKQKVSYGSFEFLNDWEKLVVEAKEYNKELIIVGILHRHPGSMSSYSGVDSDYIFGSVPVNMLMHDGKDILDKFTMYTNVSIPCDNTCFQVKKIQFTVLYNIDRDWKKEVEEKVEEQKHVYTGGYQGALPAGNGYCWNKNNGSGPDAGKSVVIHGGSQNNAGRNFQNQQVTTTGGEKAEQAPTNVELTVTYPVISESDLSLIGAYGMEGI